MKVGSVAAFTSLLTELKGKGRLRLSQDGDIYKREQASFGHAVLEVKEDSKEDSFTIRQLHRWHGCRGYMCEALLAGCVGTFKGADGKYVNMTRVRQGPTLLLAKRIPGENLRACVEMLNALESECGWEQTALRSYQDKDDSDLFLLIADERYKKALPYFSLLMLIVRLSKFNKPTVDAETFVTQDSAKDSATIASIRKLKQIYDPILHLLFSKQSEIVTPQYRAHRRIWLTTHTHGKAHEAGIDYMMSTLYELCKDKKRLTKGEIINKWLARGDLGDVSTLFQPLLINAAHLILQEIGH